MNGSGIRLDQFLQLCGAVGTGGQAKVVIQGGEIEVNGEAETRRRRKVGPDDIVVAFGNRYTFDDLPDGVEQPKSE